MAGTPLTQPPQVLNQSPQKEKLPFLVQDKTYSEEWRGCYMVDLHVCSLTIIIFYFQV